jgi:hypothetical protein
MKNRFPHPRFTTLDGKRWIKKERGQREARYQNEVKSIKGEVARLRSA